MNSSFEFDSLTRSIIKKTILFIGPHLSDIIISSFDRGIIRLWHFWHASCSYGMPRAIIACLVQLQPFYLVIPCVMEQALLYHLNITWASAHKSDIAKLYIQWKKSNAYCYTIILLNSCTTSLFQIMQAYFKGS